MSAASKLRTVKGQASWRLATAETEVFVTEQGGHMGPLTFFRDTPQAFAPLSVAPWWKESLRGVPPMLRVLRGDFFCMPFGGNETPWRGEAHPPHGETANEPWALVEAARRGGEHRLRLRMQTRCRPGTVDKHLRLVDGHDAVYIHHEISGMQGPMPLGHHAMLRFPDTPGSGRISTSPFLRGLVAPLPFERPELGGYHSLQPGAEFDSIATVPMANGGTADLSMYPARRGFEDLVMLVGDPARTLAWNAVVFPAQRRVWFALRNPAVLTHTVLWISNAGRHFPPWNGRHVSVLGIEDVTTYFHYGLAESARANPLSRAGHPTALRLRRNRVQPVPYIMGAARVPAGFDVVADIEPEAGRGVILTARNGKSVRCALDVSTLNECRTGMSSSKMSSR